MLLSALLQQLGYEARPSGLMAGANGGTVVAVEVLVKQDQVTAALHRSLIEGGIYFYPPDADHTDGKLRLLSECAPSLSSSSRPGDSPRRGRATVLDVQPTSIHQRVPLIIGSADDVGLYNQFLQRALATG